MKAIQVTAFGGPEVLELRDLPDPVPDPNQLIIEVKGASVNFADVKARKGGYHLGKTPPFVPGIDVTGMVVAVGAEVTRFCVGDRILGFPAAGSYGELAQVNENLAFALPDNVDFERAAASPIAGGTVTHMLTQIGQLEKDENLLIHTAAGGVGTMATQIAKALDVGCVVGSVGSPWKKETVLKTGVSGVVNYTDSDYPKQVMSLTEGKGVDVIINTLGGPTLERDLDCLAPFGRLILCGKLSGEDAKVNPSVMHPNNRRIIGFSFGHYRRFRPKHVKDTMELVINFLKNDQLKPVIGKKYPLSEASEAQRFVESRESIGKVLLIP